MVRLRLMIIEVEN